MQKDIRVSIGIQARSKSVRFPNKISQLIGSRMVIEHVIDACKSCAEYINRYAFTNHTTAQVFVLIPEDDPIRERLDPDFVFEGDENDVLSRYVKLQQETDANFVVRITADCPLIPPFLIHKCVNVAIKNGFDYFSNVGLAGDHMRTSIDGHDVEVISSHALKWIDENSKEKSEREHVTTAIRREDCPSFLRRGLLVGHNDHSNVKLSLDTEADLDRIRDEFEKVQNKISMAKQVFGKTAVHRF